MKLPYIDIIIVIDFDVLLNYALCLLTQTILYFNAVI